jgi:hypothetical protein
MRNDIPDAIAGFLREQGFDVHYETPGGTITVDPFGKHYISILVWHNPTLSVIVNPYDVGCSIASIDMNDPNPLDQLATAIRTWKEKNNGLG